MPGNIIDVKYSTTLMENTSLDLTTVFLLDQVQRNKSINKEARAKLRELNLIEGRHPHIIISRKVAQLTNMEAEYTDLKGFDDDYYKDLILKSLSDHKKLRRTHIDKLLLPRLPKALNYKIPESGVISRPAASTSCRSFFITSAGIHLLATLTVLTRLRLRTISIGANLLLSSAFLSRSLKS